MSSSTNHRKRSHRSQSRHDSAMQGEQRHIIAQRSRSAGAPGAPLIFRLSAFRQHIRESRAKAAEGDAKA